MRRWTVGSCFLANAWLGACDQAADVRVMTGEHQHGDHQRKLNDGRIGQDGGEDRRQRERRERGEGRQPRDCRQ